MKVSVIIPTYNRDGFLKRAIKSVLSQTFQDFELIIIDDGSTDNTKEVINSFQNDKIKYFSSFKRERDLSHYVLYYIGYKK